MRVFIAALATETNAFSPLPGTLRGFEEGVLFHGDATANPVTLFTEPLHVWRRCAEVDGVEVIESLAAMAQPSGPVSRLAYQQLLDELLRDLREAMPVDIVLLMLHGAMSAQGTANCEADIVAHIRAIVGDNCRIGVLLDLHAGVSRTLLEHCDVVTCCHLYPHTDFGERARQLYRVISVAHSPVMAHTRIDMLGFYPTSAPAMQVLVERMSLIEKEPRMLAVSLVHGFPWSDTPDTGAGVIVATDDDPELATTVASRLAKEFVQARHDSPKLLRIDEAIDQALESDRTPVVIADICDNAGGGAPGDSTFLLEALLARNVKDAAVALLWDPVAVDIASAAGEGARLLLRVGGKTAVSSGRPLDVEVEVVRVLESAHQRGLDGNSLDSLGRGALLRIGGVLVVLNSRRQQVFSPDCFTQFGVRLADLRILVVKSTQHFAAQFQNVAVRFIHCQTPGCLTVDFATLPYRNIRRPMWPLDDGEPPVTTVMIAKRRRA